MKVISENITWRNWITLFILAIIWGSSFILMKKSLVALSPYQVAAFRIIFACLTLLPFLAKVTGRLSRRDLKYIFLSALFGTGLPPFLFTIAQTKVDSAMAGILNSLTPLCTLFLGILFFGAKLKWMRILGVILGMAGAVGLIFYNNKAASAESHYYSLFIILATVSYGVSANILKSRLQQVHPLTITIFSFIMLAPFAAAILLFQDVQEINFNKAEVWKALGFTFILATAGTGYALIFFNRLVQDTNAVFASTVAYLIPVAAVGWGLLDGEIISLFHFIGMGLILTGIYLTR